MSVKEAALRLQLIDGVTRSSKAISAALKGVSGAVAGFNSRAAAANSAFQASAIQAAALGAAVLQPIRAAAALEDRMADIAKVSALSAQGLSAMRGELVQMSREMPLSAQELAELAAGLAAGGVADTDLLDMTKLVARVAVAYGMAGKEAGESLGKIQAALSFTVAETAAYADQINALSDGTASAATDLVDFSRRVGSLGKQYGYTNAQVLAYGSAMVSAGATSEQAATGFQAVGRALVKGNAATSTQRTALKRLGLTSKGVAKGMAKDALATTEDVLERVRKLPEWEKASVLNQLFGDEARVFMPLVENTDLMATSLRILADEGKVAGSVLREFQVRTSTTSGKVAKLRNRVLAAGLAFGNALLPAISDTADGLGPLVDNASRYLETNEKLVGRVSKVAAGMVAGRLAMTGMRAGLYALLRPTNLLIAGLGFLAYQNFDSVSGALKDFQAVAADLSKTAFAQGFLKGAREGLEGMATSARELAGYLASISREGTALRQWLDSVAGGGAGETLGKVAAGLGAVLAATALLRPVLGPLRVLFRLVSGLGRAAGSIRGTAKALDAVNDSARRAQGIGRPSLWSMAFGAIGMVDAVGAIPTDQKELKDFVNKNYARSDAANSWLERNIGSPRSWLGLDQQTPEPVVDREKAGKQREGLADQTKGWSFAAQQGMRDLVSVLAAGGATAETEASRIAEDIKAQLQIQGTVDINTGALEKAVGLAREYAATLRGTAPAAVPAVPAPLAGARARGGPVRRGLNYLVGERGPEIFTPGASGKVTSNRDARSTQSGRPPVTVHAPISIAINGASASDLAKVARQAAEAVSAAMAGALDGGLNRSAQVAFSNLKYGDR